MSTESLIEEAQAIDANINSSLKEGRRVRPAGWEPTPKSERKEWRPTGWTALSNIEQLTGKPYSTLHNMVKRGNVVDGLVMESRPATKEDLAALHLDRRTKHLHRLVEARSELPATGADEYLVPVEAPKEKPDGIKFDHNKPQPRLLPMLGLGAVIDVLTFGAKKYAPDNWQIVPKARERYTDALLRHVFAWMAGETNDPESGLHHLAHAGCCVLFLLHFELGES